MSVILWHLAVGLVLSFIGSIPFGTINMTAAETAFRHGFTTAIWFSFGAAIIEFGQAVLCLHFSTYLTSNPTISLVFQWASIPVFLGLAYYLFTRRDQSPSDVTTANAERVGFLKGVLISALNFLAIPYWIFLSGYLSANDWIKLDSFRIILVFGTGVFLGTMLLLLLYARIGIYAGEKSKKGAGLAWVLSGFFVLLAAIQLIRMLAG